MKKTKDEQREREAAELLPMIEPNGQSDIFIQGPTVHGLFFIMDKNYRCWDGREWRGFGGPPKGFESFREAWVEAARLNAH